MIAYSNNFAIINLSTSSTDFLCKHSPLLYAVELYRSTGRRIMRAFLLEEKMIGKTFGRWTIIGKIFKTSKSKSFAACKCTCGTIRDVSISSLKNKTSKSCGCLRIERVVRHGDHLTKLYALWRNLRHRCNCPTSKDYKHYGARGIKVHYEWNNYIAFKKWAIKSKYKEGLTIERKDTNSGYNPKNCIFTTIAENNKNRRNTKWWFIDGKKFKSFYDASIYFGVSVSKIQRWCNGETVKKKYYYPPKKNCYSIEKYGDKNANN